MYCSRALWRNALISHWNASLGGVLSQLGKKGGGVPSRIDEIFLGFHNLVEGKVEASSLPHLNLRSEVWCGVLSPLPTCGSRVVGLFLSPCGPWCLLTGIQLHHLIFSVRRMPPCLLSLPRFICFLVFSDGHLVTRQTGSKVCRQFCYVYPLYTSRRALRLMGITSSSANHRGLLKAIVKASMSDEMT
jgi:hypothetical protein